MMKQKIKILEKGMEKKETLYTDSGNAIWFSY